MRQVISSGLVASLRFERPWRGRGGRALLAGTGQSHSLVARPSLVLGMRRKPLQPRHPAGGRDCREIRSEVRAAARPHRW